MNPGLCVTSGISPGHINKLMDAIERIKTAGDPDHELKFQEIISCQETKKGLLAQRPGGLNRFNDSNPRS
jgi:hypothetical protein